MAQANLDLEISRGTNFGPVEITCKADGVVVPLAGYSAYAEVRKSAGGTVILDLAPVIEDEDAIGLITLPEVSHTLTDDIPAMDAKWDLILQDPSGKRLPPIIGGRVSINQPITQPA